MGVSHWREKLQGPAHTLSVQFLRYGVVGGVAFGVDYGSLFLLTEFASVHYLVSAPAAFTLGLLTNYLLSVSWVFDRRTLSNRSLEFFIFALIGAVGLGLNELVIWFLTEKASLHYLLSKLVSSAVVLLWNFFARRFTLFR